jgi:hypothetical protein
VSLFCKIISGVTLTLAAFVIVFSFLGITEAARQETQAAASMQGDKDVFKNMKLEGLAQAAANKVTAEYLERDNRDFVEAKRDMEGAELQCGLAFVVFLLSAIVWLLADLVDRQGKQTVTAEQIPIDSTAAAD